MKGFTNLFLISSLFSVISLADSPPPPPDDSLFGGSGNSSQAAPPPPPATPNQAQDSPPPPPIDDGPAPSLTASAAEAAQAHKPEKARTAPISGIEDENAPPPEIINDPKAGSGMADDQPPLDFPPEEIKEEAPQPPKKVARKQAAPKTAPVMSAPQAQETNDDSLSAGDRTSEQRFARIYQKFNSDEIDNTKWEEIAGQKVAETYTLQNGDTLWDISSKFFGNGFYWPKVWSINDEITNPHLISVGNQIRFSPGSSSQPPQVSVDSDGNQIYTPALDNTLSENDTPPSDDDDMDIENVPSQQFPSGSAVIIPPGRKTRPVLTRIPPSFPETNRWRLDGYDRYGFQIDTMEKGPPPAHPTTIPSIITDRGWESSGEIIEMDGDRTVAATFQNVILRMRNDTTLNVGDFVTFFSSGGDIKDPVEGGTVGEEIDTRGEAKITAVIPGTRSTYRAMVVYTAMPVRIGDKIKVGRLILKDSLKIKGQDSNIFTRIVNGELNNRQVFNVHSVVFLNRGTQDGLQLDNVLPILRDTRQRNSDSIMRIDPLPIGTMKIVALGDHVATAVILKESDAVLIGDVSALNGDPVSEEDLDKGPAPGTQEVEDPAADIGLIE